MRRITFTFWAVAISLTSAENTVARVELPSQTVQLSGAQEDAARKAKESDALYASCTFVAGLPEEPQKSWVLPLMLLIKTTAGGKVPPEEGPVSRPYSETFVKIQDPRGIFDPAGTVTVLDRRPAYMMIEWKDSNQRDAILLLPYAGAAGGLHFVKGILGHGHLAASLDPKDWKVTPAGSLDDVMLGRCRILGTARDSVVMEQAQ